MVTEVGRDALAEPPNYEALRRTLSIVDEPVIAAGGVRNIEDLLELKALTANGRQLSGIVVGREVTAGRFTVEEAAALVRRSEGSSGPWSLDELQAGLNRYRDSVAEVGDVSDVEAFLAWLTKNSPHD
jgi:tRNA-dihydrouridine synthase